MTWSLAQAKDQLSEVVRRARSIGPQTISVRGREEAVVVSKAEFDALRSGVRDGGSAATEDDRPWMRARTFKEFLLNAPDMSDLDLERRCSGHREVDLSWVDDLTDPTAEGEAVAGCKDNPR